MGDPERGGSAAGLISAIASLISAVAWPLLVALIIYAVYKNFDKVLESTNRFMEGKSSAKIGLSPTGGLSVEIVEKTANTSAGAVIESARKSDTGPLNEAQISQVTSSAQSAAISLASNAFDPQKRLKILWVDDHPTNNMDLQFAFQTLGILVICVDSNAGIKQAFSHTSGFDVVITDINRDSSGSRLAEPQGGLETVDIVHSNFPNTKIIIYAGSWAATHRNDPKTSSIIQITSYPQEIYRTVVDLAKSKAS